MTIALWTLLAAAIVPYVFAGLAKSRRDFDNARPREWLARAEGWRQRAHWAQLNSYEAYPPFAAAVLTAELTGAAQGWVDALAVLFVLLRLAYGAAYVADRSTLRSTLWAAAFACVAGLFIAAAVAGG